MFFHQTLVFLIKYLPHVTCGCQHSFVSFCTVSVSKRSLEIQTASAVSEQLLIWSLTSWNVGRNSTWSFYLYFHLLPLIVCCCGYCCFFIFSCNLRVSHFLCSNSCFTVLCRHSELGLWDFSFCLQGPVYHRPEWRGEAYECKWPASGPLCRGNPSPREGVPVCGDPWRGVSSQLDTRVPNGESDLWYFL